MNNDEELNNLREKTLNLIEKKERNFRLLIIFIALLEVSFLLALVLNINWSNQTHIVIFFATMLVYLVLGAGLLALAVYQNINTLKVLKAIDVIIQE